MYIKSKNVSWSKENGIWRGVIEASEAGLPPGSWPVSILVEGVKESKIFVDETLPHPSSIAKANEEGRNYRSQCGGLYIKILND